MAICRVNIERNEVYKEGSMQQMQAKIKDVFEKAYQFSKPDEMRKAGVYPYFTQFTGGAGPSEAIVKMGELDILMFGSNNYLGLTTHPEVKEFAIKAIEKYGTGCSGSRMLNGTMDIHVKLEEELARFMKRDASIVFGTGFQTNSGALSTLAHKGDSIIADKNIHASIFDGCLSSRANILRYRHNEMSDLEKVLQGLSPDEARIIVVDGVFSMEGDLADLPGLVKLARQHGARVYDDEAHGIGVLGENGRGAAEYFGVEDDIDIIMGTFSKSLGSIGGFVAADAKIIDYIKHTSRAFVFSASLAPANAAAVLKAIEIIEREPERRANLKMISDTLRKELRLLGFTVPDGITPILPVVINDEFLVWKFFWELLKDGIYTNPVVAPAVTQSIIRISCMATHKLKHVERLVETMGRIGKSVGLIN